MTGELPANLKANPRLARWLRFDAGGFEPQAFSELRHDLLFKGKEEFLAVHLVVIDHEAVIGLVELADLVAVVRTEHKEACPLAYGRQVERLIDFLDLEPCRFKNETHRILGFFPHVVFHRIKIAMVL